MSKEFQTGIVNWFDPIRNYGFISLSATEKLFLHRNEIRGVDKNPMSGDTVTFQIGQTEKGRCAREVRITLKGSTPVVAKIQP